MNTYEINNFTDTKRHILAFAAGIVGAYFPNDKSNSTPMLNGALFAAFIVKFLYRDYDKGYQWTMSDLLFWSITLLEGCISAYLITQVF